MLFRLLNLLLVTVFLTGCGSVHFDNVKMNNKGVPVASKLSHEQKRSMTELTQAIKGLSPSISSAEANIVAHDSIVYSMVLANKYELTYPPHWHNVLVNSKKRKRGLCYHWQRDLISHMRKKNLKTVTFIEAVAHEKDYWREHNTMIVAAKGDTFEKGIVLDPWRNSGILTWATVKEDKYPWKLRIWKNKNKKKQLAKKRNGSPAPAL